MTLKLAVKLYDDVKTTVETKSYKTIYFIVIINTLSTYFTFVFIRDPTNLLVIYNLDVSAHFTSYVTTLALHTEVYCFNI